MNNFTLSKPAEKVLPDSVCSASGGTFAINPAFQNILRILRMLDDPEVLQKHKPLLLAEWFFKDAMPVDAIELFQCFMEQDEPESGYVGEKTFCFEFDAKEIYAAFRQEYGIDLLRESMHWYVFRALLSSVLGGENALGRKLRLRTLDTSKYENRKELELAKRAVQIPNKIGRTDKALNDQITEALMHGGDVAALIRQVKERG